LNALSISLIFHSRFIIISHVPVTVWMMRATKLLMAVLACGSIFQGSTFAQVAKGAELPEMPGAQVTIPYSELKMLWAAARAGEEARPAVVRPPVDALVVSAEYDLRFDGDRVALDAIYQVQSFVERWQTQPVLAGEARLESMVGGEVLWIDECYQLMLEGKGARELKLSFDLGRLMEGDSGVHLVPPAASLNKLSVLGLRVGKVAKVNGRLGKREGVDGGLVWSLAGKSEELRVTMERFVEPVPVAKIGPPLPSPWDVQSELFVRYQEGRLVYECHLYGQASEGSGVGMDLFLPHNVLNLSVVGEDLDRHKLGSKKDGERGLHLEWKTRDILNRKVQLRYELPQSPMSLAWAVVAPKVGDAGETRSFFVLESVEGLELRGSDVRGGVQSRRLPEWIRKLTGPNDFLTAEGAARLELNATWLPRLETAQATVSKAVYITRLVEDGAVLVEGSYFIQHQAPLAWQLHLPVYDQILTCKVNDRAVEPIKRGEREIEFLLGAPEGGESKVTFCFAAQVEAFDAVSGRVEVSLPKTDLFIHDLKWALSIPPEYEAEIQGNVSIDRLAGAAPSHLMNLKKELVRGEHPAVEIHYQRKGLDD
jgi:hypothetical protein